MTPKSKTDLLAIQKKTQDAVKMVMPSVVGLEVGGARGSGVIISPDGYVLTAGHVARRPNAAIVFQLPNGKRVRGKALGINFGIDSGLAKITDEGDYPWVPMGKSGDLRRGEWVLAIGHPGGYKRDRPAVVRIGRVIFSNASVIRTDGTLVGGDSGGPMRL